MPPGEEQRVEHTELASRITPHPRSPCKPAHAPRNSQLGPGLKAGPKEGAPAKNKLSSIAFSSSSTASGSQTSGMVLMSNGTAEGPGLGALGGVAWRFCLTSRQSSSSTIEGSSKGSISRSGSSAGRRRGVGGHTTAICDLLLGGLRTKPLSL
eukprot:CAMPEP_0181450458 /NCGR_PEP_ID=MMETSP1110-20121109/28186_1 /TAXON_ID=174948 /ORGANISM="Symbiodinium sp., Strain CCMP421" /LENGTH=152 /DNA_ID=CAMNT_0023574679 /DNA_START=410 /DNA_END=868 /DNA_ORIENTATION=-